MPRTATACAGTGLGIPECSCPDCTTMIVERWAPEPIRNHPVYRLASRPRTQRRALDQARGSTAVRNQLGQVIPFPPDVGSRGVGGGPGLISVVLAHRSALTRAAIGSLLTAEHDISVAGLAADADAAVALAQRQRPDVVMLDIGLGGLDPVEATRRLLVDPASDRIRVVILASSTDADRIIDALSAGAHAVVSENTQPEKLMRALRVVAGGDLPPDGSGAAGLVLTEV